MKVVIELWGGNWFTMYSVSEIKPQGDGKIIFYTNGCSDILAIIRQDDIASWNVFEDN